ncbi:MotA/TolQ/ExbB proton channel family protein [Zymomonas sp.]|uniref:MotA/TolQ/ExbB proton channel family protein n=1 Tax=Zymomonas sp. TaxID=2068624 RepID=UPI0025DA2D0A|nr:MotA/TolQ/ExbB proton channel family protein [Zymomonas sp.]MCA1956233.1 MotA/TolQ/ExbB proton channel family protein [Zymomonas sp.]
MATPAAPAVEASAYGLTGALQQGGAPTWTVLIILVLMSAASWYVIFTKLWEQHRVLVQSREVGAAFWNAPSLKDAAKKLEENTAYRQIVEDGLDADAQYVKIPNAIDQHEWLNDSLERSVGSINARLGSGLAILATVGATSPFVGLFGTVNGIYGALVQIGASGQASIGKVAGPVGEALIMTSIGLAVAVPAVLGYNWLSRRNKTIAERIGSFAIDVHAYLVSGGAVRPEFKAAPAAAAKKPAPVKH